MNFWKQKFTSCQLSLQAWVKMLYISSRVLILDSSSLVGTLIKFPSSDFIINLINSSNLNLINGNLKTRTPHEDVFKRRHPSYWDRLLQGYLRYESRVWWSLDCASSKSYSAWVWCWTLLDYIWKVGVQTICKQAQALLWIRIRNKWESQGLEE